MKVFITGITGTLGKEVLKLLIPLGYDVTGLTRDELKLKQMINEFGPRMALGDVRDFESMERLTKGVDILFHFAALKHIDLMEKRTEECIKTNLYATENIYHIQKANNIKRVVFSSTDKAVYPINVYGMCKAISERIILRNKNNVVCRYGNVLASRGSAIHIFKEHIKANQPIPITHEKMTRFWITIKNAAEFVVSKGLGYKPGLFIPKIKSYGVVDLAQLLYDKINDYPEGVGKKVEIKNIGMRPGEKIHECLYSAYESGKDLHSNFEHYTRDEMLDLIKDII